MVIVAIASVLSVGVMLYILSVRVKDLPAPEPESPFRHLDDRKAAIYENLRDLQFEYRLGKLSDQDYQTTKRDLQKELATVLAEVDKLKQQLAPNGAVAPPPVVAPSANSLVCPSCGAKFDRALKFCGECGKAMTAGK